MIVEVKGIAINMRHVTWIGPVHSAQFESTVPVKLVCGETLKLDFGSDDEALKARKKMIDTIDMLNMPTD